MFELFFISILGLILIYPIYLISLNFTYLDKRFGTKKGRIYGNITGMISGWGLFLFLFGIWLSPQDKFSIPIYNEMNIVISELYLEFNLIHILISFPLIIISSIIAIIGVKNITLKVAETHRPEKVIFSGMYKYIRHPQYLGAILAHIGVSILLSAFFSLLITPFIVFYFYLLAKKEEKELIKVFKEEYISYISNTSMFIPKLI